MRIWGRSIRFEYRREGIVIWLPGWLSPFVQVYQHVGSRSPEKEVVVGSRGERGLRMIGNCRRNVRSPFNDLPYGSLRVIWVDLGPSVTYGDERDLGVDASRYGEASKDGLKELPLRNVHRRKVPQRGAERSPGHHSSGPPPSHHPCR